ASRQPAVREWGRGWTAALPLEPPFPRSAPMKRELAVKSLIAVGLCAAALATARTPAGAPPAPAKAPARPAATATTTAAPAHTTGQTNQSCGSSTAPNTPGNAVQAPGSAFNPDGKAGT